MVEAAAELAARRSGGTRAERPSRSLASPRRRAAALRRLIADPAPKIRAWAARGLGDVGDLVDLPRMEPLLADPAPSPRMQAMRAGARILARTRRCPRSTGGGSSPGSWTIPSRGCARRRSSRRRRGSRQAEVRQAVFRRLTGGEPRERELALLALARRPSGGSTDPADPARRPPSGDPPARPSGPPRARRRSGRSSASATCWNGSIVDPGADGPGGGDRGVARGRSRRDKADPRGAVRAIARQVSDGSRSDGARDRARSPRRVA